jgi:hypothetical protein
MKLGESPTSGLSETQRNGLPLPGNRKKLICRGTFLREERCSSLREKKDEPIQLQS